MPIPPPADDAPARLLGQLADHMKVGPVSLEVSTREAWMSVTDRTIAMHPDACALELPLLAACMAHELVHVRDRHALTQARVSVSYGLLALLVVVAGGVGVSTWACLVVAVTACLLWVPFERAVSRHHELAADAEAGRALSGVFPAMSGYGLMADALEAASAQRILLPLRPLPGAGVRSSIWVYRVRSSLLAMHPPIDQRIARLRRMQHRQHSSR